MRRRREKQSTGLNVWRSYSDMMAGILLLFVLIMCVTLFQSQINYENSIRERDEKLLLQEEYTKEIMSQKDEEKKKKKKQSILEKEIFGIMEKSMKAALDAAVDDLLKDWDKEIKIKL